MGRERGKGREEGRRKINYGGEKIPMCVCVENAINIVGSQTSKRDIKILSYLILSYLILFYLILSYLILSYRFLLGCLTVFKSVVLQHSVYRR